jgi:hypothetical protein
MLFFNNLTNHFINFELLTNLKSKHLGSCSIKTITEQKKSFTGHKNRASKLPVRPKKRRSYHKKISVLLFKQILMHLY